MPKTRLTVYPSNHLTQIFRDPDLDGIYQWVDKSSVLYWNNTLQTTDKFGMINKNTGKWSTKGSTTMLAYRVCSKFGKSQRLLTQSIIYIITKKQFFMNWSVVLLNVSLSVTCWDITNAVGNGTVSFDKSSRENNTVATVTCNSGMKHTYTHTHTREHTYIHTHTHIYTHIHTYTRARTHTQEKSHKPQLHKHDHELSICFTVRRGLPSTELAKGH